MSRLKSGAVLLLLAIPFVLYAVWQLQGVTRADLIISDPPSEKGLPTKEQLATTRAKAEKWASDVRKTSAVVFQYRVPTAEDAAEDADCTALARAVAMRSADLADLETFLANREKPTYTGALKASYTEWQASKILLAKAEERVEKWLATTLTNVDGFDAASRAMTVLNELVADYTKDSKFADSSKAAAWQIEARVKVIESLEQAARKPYDEVLALPLPLPGAAKSKLVEQALGAPAAIRDQADVLKRELAKAEDAKMVLPARVATAAKATMTRASEWAAKEQLLALFADPELFTDPNKAAEWLPKVQAEFEKTQTPGGRELFRNKVKQFCEAYIPKVVRLDTEVLLLGKPESRTKITIVYDSDAKEKPLTDDLDGVNEFNFPKQHLNFKKVTWLGGSDDSSSLKPTPKSIAARAFTLARADVTTWSATTVNQLKKKCEGEAAALQQENRKLTDELVGFAAASTSPTWTRENTKLWTRLTGLSTAMAKFPMLFEMGQ